MTDDILVEIRGMKKYFPIKSGIFKKTQGYVKAVDGVSFSIKKGETIGLVGESGCGKTTTGRCALMLTKPTDGDVFFKMPKDVRAELDRIEKEIQDKGEKRKQESARLFDQRDEIFQKYALNHMDQETIRKFRKNMQIVFQDPYSSLNPRFLIKDIIAEPLLVHGIGKGEKNLEYVENLIQKVGLNPDHLYRYPHEFSGGQRQRIGVARALALNPDLIVLDEPTSALDVSVQSQILNLLNDLKKEFGMSYLFISHDLSTIRYMCDRVNVMYLGKIVESGTNKELFKNPLHPYTEALLSVIPVPDPDYHRERITLSGDVPSPSNPPSGCRFHTRCRYRQAICEEIEPQLEDKGNGHLVACHFR